MYACIICVYVCIYVYVRIYIIGMFLCKHTYNIPIYHRYVSIYVHTKYLCEHIHMYTCVFSFCLGVYIYIYSTRRVRGSAFHAFPDNMCVCVCVCVCVYVYSTIRARGSAFLGGFDLTNTTITGVFLWCQLLLRARYN